MRVNISNLEAKLKRSELGSLRAVKDITIYVGIKDPEIAQIAWWNEFGCWNEKAGHMNPARPFMQQTFSGVGARNIKKCIEGELNGYIQYIKTRRGQNATISKRQGIIRDMMQDIANYAANEVKLTIGDGNFVPNSEYTIKRKKHSTVLVDTLQMKKSIKGWIE